MFAIEVENLNKRYGRVCAADEVSFTTSLGEVMGLLGPNGAGKTTTVEILEGLREPDSGSVRVLGLDVRLHSREIKQRIGLQLQSTSFFQRLTVRETLALFGSFFKRSSPAERLVEKVGLQEKMNTCTGELSGGQRQRLAVALALVNDPEIIFLDEPTTGLDPQARRALWQVIESLRSDGKCILLTTHYMEEAERLCDRVAVMDRGKIIACGSPRQLIRQNFEHTALEFATPSNIPLDDLRRLPHVESMSAKNGTTTLYSSQTTRTIEALTRISGAHDAELESFTVRRATLEDVFLKLTGRKLLE